MKRDSVLPAARFDLASFGELVSDPSRVTMLLSLMDGLARPASELATLSAITPATASFHLARLVSGGLLAVEPLGRHRYFRLASEQVADAIEAVALLRPSRATKRTESPDRLALTAARTCYSHLAGRLGVDWLSALERKRFLTLRDGGIALTARGVAWFSESGLTIKDGMVGKTCLDWTERRHHLGGPLGALLTRHLFDAKWIARGREGRSVRLTTKGKREMESGLGMRT